MQDYRIRWELGILLVLSLGLLSGCGEGKGPSWLRLGKPKPKVEPKVEKVEGTVLALIDEAVITLEDFNSRIQAYNTEIQNSPDIPESVRPNYLITTLEDKKRLLDGMVERKLLVSEAVAKGLDKEEDFQQAIAALREQLLFTKIIEAERAKVNVTTKDVENHYNLYKDAFKIAEERRVSIIVVPSEDKAKEILIQLLQGADFGTLARENSTDKSATSGGDIGFIVQSSPFPQPDKKTVSKKFEEVAFALELNKPSTIFQGPEGFYIIKVTEVKEARQLLLSEVYNDIEKGLLLRKQDDALKNLVDNLRRSSNIITHDELLKE